MVHEVNDSNFDEIIEQNKTVMLDIWADWCGPCKMISPIVDEIANEREDVFIGKLNADENQFVLQKYMIRGIPAILFFKDGQLKEKSIGFVSKAILENKLTDL